VKARASQIEAERALDEYRLRRVAAAAQALAARYERVGDTLRIDAIFIVPRRWPMHMKDVWRG
jgi:putative endonuclease